jgi:D-serine deaminase-like pyridoxal phosphate-dependent protein
MNIDDLDTPTPVIDLDLVERNIQRAQDYANRHGIALRPHIKTHKLPEFAHLQVQAGARGITCQKIGEAEVMADAGISDILISFNIVGRAKLERLRSLARRANLKVVADSEAVLRGLSETFAGETGAGRCGVATPAAAAALAKLAAELPGLSFRGLMTYPPKHRVQDVAGWLEAARAACRHAGVEVPEISSGGTPDLFHAHEQNLVTEYRPGTYIYSDRAQVAHGHGTFEDCALRIVATVVSRPAADRCIIDAGSKTLSSDTQGLSGFGHIVEYPQMGIVALSEEHGHCQVPAGTRGPAVGERVTIIPNHVCVVTNLFDRIPAVRNGRVEAMFTVAARGKVQ